MSRSRSSDRKRRIRPSFACPAFATATSIRPCRASAAAIAAPTAGSLATSATCRLTFTPARACSQAAFVSSSAAVSRPKSARSAPARGEVDRDRAADAPARAGDHGDFARS